MEHRRTIGRWALTGLMVNSMVGSGIFGLPGTLLRILGDASPWAFVLAGLVIAVVVACFAEVGSRFARAGGPYLYVRTAFGRFAGIQVAWFATLGPVAAGAAQANLFTAYLAEFNASFDLPLLRALVITGVLAYPFLPPTTMRICRQRSRATRWRFTAERGPPSCCKGPPVRNGPKSIPAKPISSRSETTLSFAA